MTILLKYSYSSGIAYRDKVYDGYMNSQECLYGPGSEFLSQYTLLLRADLDTFPSPRWSDNDKTCNETPWTLLLLRFLNFWPWGIIVDKHYLTNHNRDNIKNALRDLACAAGLEHHDWFNPGSSWYGDARRIRNMAKLTVALYKFGRAQMFGPGTTCR